MVGPPRVARRRAAGLTLVEAIISLVLLSILAALILPRLDALDQWSIARAARLTERHLAGARLDALAHRRPVRVRLTAGRILETVDGSGRLVSRLDLRASALRPLDSVRVRPANIRYNARGQGAAGSVYLYRGHRGVRVVSNFVGRIRRHSFRF